MAVAHAAGPLARVHVLGKQPALVNQQIRFEVEILAPNYFTSAPQFPNIQIPGAIVTMPDESGQNAVEKIGTETYASITKTYVFAAQQAGDFVLPPLVVKFTYGGDEGKPMQGQVKLPPTKISAKIPEGAAATPGGAVQPVAKVTIQQSFDRAPAGKAFELQAGDALVRTVNTYAELTQSMMIPPPKIDAPTGVRVFAADPKLNDITKDRVGLVGGQRTDKITYVFEKTGSYTLPAVDVGWFNAATNKSETAEAPAVTVMVAARTAGDAIAPEQAPAPVVQQKPDPFWRHIRWTQWLESALALVALAFAARWLAPRMRAWREAARQRRAAYASSEPALFEAVVQAFHGGKPAAAYAAVMVWSRQALGASVAAWSGQMQDSELTNQWRDFEAGLFSHAAPTEAAWQGDALLNALRATRKRWLASSQARAEKGNGLPTLNPGVASRG
ncbi:BatD family protein [Variovorax sp. HJSM1_2]|uniref:BatD family protein n=1 Tax=Variovorax sp. HJSM1_2 TaxID=3366263 RepID=UPI003BCD86D2